MSRFLHDGQTLTLAEPTSVVECDISWQNRRDLMRSATIGAVWLAIAGLARLLEMVEKCQPRAWMVKHVDLYLYRQVVPWTDWTPVRDQGVRYGTAENARHACKRAGCGRVVRLVPKRRGGGK